MLNILTLPPDRYHELLAFGAFLQNLPNPATSKVVVVEDSETHEVKGFWVAQATIHIEPVYLTPEAQDGGHTGLKMLALLLSELAAMGEPQFFAFAETESVVDYLIRLGLTPLPYTIFKGLNPLVLASSE